MRMNYLSIFTKKVMHYGLILKPVVSLLNAVLMHLCFLFKFAKCLDNKEKDSDNLYNSKHASVMITEAVIIWFQFSGKDMLIRMIFWIFWCYLKYENAYYMMRT